MREVIIFDLDGTLAPSKSHIDAEMEALLEKLLDKMKVVVISGGRWRQFKEQLLNYLKLPSEKLNSLFLQPTGGSSMYRFDNGEVREMYADILSRDERNKIMEAFNYALPKAGYVTPQIHFGEIIEDRQSEITFSALGQKAPLDQKERWDPDHKKRLEIVKYLKEKIPEFEVHIGGTTSIDVLKKGEDKAFGINKVVERLGISIQNMLFIGDALYPGGNDEPAKKTGIECIEVKNVEETKRMIREIIAS
ncbi:MAG: HAD-IIB family hydrolase [Patescibacteria group bacterium]